MLEGKFVDLRLGSQGGRELVVVLEEEGEGCAVVGVHVGHYSGLHDGVGRGGGGGVFGCHFEWMGWFGWRWETLL